LFSLLVRGRRRFRLSLIVVKGCPIFLGRFLGDGCLGSWGWSFVPSCPIVIFYGLGLIRLGTTCIGTNIIIKAIRSCLEKCIFIDILLPKMHESSSSITR
jgi:hypothetical protein